MIHRVLKLSRIANTSILLLSAVLLLTVFFFTKNSFAQVSFGDALVDAADKNAESTVSQLLRSSYPVDSKGKFGVTALMRSAFHGNERITKMLLEVGANPNSVDIGGATALHLASREGHLEIVRLLIKNNGFVDIADNDGWTPLMRASLANKEEVVSELLDEGADINSVNKLDETPLMHAVQKRNLKIVKLLLDKGADAKHVNAAGFSVLDIARRKRNKDLENLILSATGKTPLQKKDTDVAEAKIKSLDKPFEHRNMSIEMKDQSQKVKEEKKDDLFADGKKSKEETLEIVKRINSIMNPSSNEEEALEKEIAKAELDDEEADEDLDDGFTEEDIEEEKADTNNENKDSKKDKNNKKNEIEISSAILPKENNIKEVKIIPDKNAIIESEINNPEEEKEESTLTQIIPQQKPRAILNIVDGTPWLKESGQIDLKEQLKKIEKEKEVALSKGGLGVPASMRDRALNKVITEVASTKNDSTEPESPKVEVVTSAKSQATEKLSASDEEEITESLAAANTPISQAGNESITEQPSINVDSERIEQVLIDGRPWLTPEELRDNVPERISLAEQKKAAVETQADSPVQQKNKEPEKLVVQKPVEVSNIKEITKEIPKDEELKKPIKIAGIKIPAETKPPSDIEDRSVEEREVGGIFREEVASEDIEPEDIEVDKKLQKLIADDGEKAGETIQVGKLEPEKQANELKEEVVITENKIEKIEKVQKVEIPNKAASVPMSQQVAKLEDKPIITEKKAPEPIKQEQQKISDVKAAPDKDKKISDNDIMKSLEQELLSGSTPQKIEDSPVKAVEDDAENLETADKEDSDSSGRVEVSEAIRVPLTEAKNVSLTKNPSEVTAPKKTPFGFSPSTKDSGQNFWLELGKFDSEQQAISYFEQVTVREKLYLRMRVVQPAANIPSSLRKVSLRIGTFASNQEAADACLSFRSVDLSCAIIKDSGSNSAPAKTVRNARVGYERGTYQNEFAYPSGGAGSDYFWVQLGTFSNEFEAISHWQNLRKDNADILDALKVNLTTPPKSSSASQSLRLRAGPFMARADANATCRSLKKRSVSCLAVAGK